MPVCQEEPVCQCQYVRRSQCVNASMSGGGSTNASARQIEPLCEKPMRGQGQEEPQPDGVSYALAHLDCAFACAVLGDRKRMAPTCF
eukprot:1160578-Pelagomonas_calceolata.AAC.4